MQAAPMKSTKGRRSAAAFSHDLAFGAGRGTRGGDPVARATRKSEVEPGSQSIVGH